MKKIEHNIINNPQIEMILQGMVGIAELLFPDRIRSYYLTGSYADDTAVSTSDLDLLLIFKERLTDEERNAIWDLSDHTALLAPMFLDLEGVGEDQIAQKGVQLKLASHFIYGEDIRHNVQLPPIDDYVREWMHDHPLHFMMRLARGQESILYPLNFPDPNDPFMGYGKNPIESKKDTKLLTAIVGQIATAIVIHKAHVYVPTKRDCLALYQEHINDEWVDFIGQVYKVCRNQWEYQIPDEPSKQEELQNICKRTLDFENYFLLVYQDYLLAELKKKDEVARLKAIKKSGEIIYPDQAIATALEDIKMSEDNLIRHAILESLTKIRAVHKERINSVDNHIRLVAIDLDGTLLDADGNLPPRGSRLVKVAFDSGIHIIISTTRNYSDVQKICIDLGIHDPIICSNGAYIFENPTGDIWQQHLIPLHVAKKICQIADENNWELSISTGNTTYLKQRPNQKLGRLTEHPYNENIEIVPTNQAALLEQPHRILTWQPQAIRVIKAVCSKEFEQECRTEIYYKPNGTLHSLGLFGRDADKGAALQFVSEKLGVDVQNVMAIGDNANDLPMFDSAGFKVAMGNATNNVKQAATIIAPSNEDEGVAWILENYVLLNKDDQSTDVGT